MGGDSKNHIAAVVTQISQHCGVVNITFAKRAVFKIEIQPIKDLQGLSRGANGDRDAH